MGMPGFVTPAQIRETFFAYLADTGSEGIAYRDLWKLLKSQGAQIRGQSDKAERDTVYKALAGAPGIRRARPGFFVPDS
jgi:hypothetical protein